jgi:hypothetical protein
MVATASTLAFATPAAAQRRTVSNVIDAGGVDVWMDHREYRPFEKAEVGFRGLQGYYLLVMRIGDDGYRVQGRNTIEILSPASLANSSQVPTDSDFQAAFKVRGGPGTTGAVYAIASRKPFDFSKVSQRFRWQNNQPPGADQRQDVAGRVVEKLGVRPEDIVGIAVDAYDVVNQYGKAAQRPLRSQYDLSTDIFRRCEMRSKEAWCESFWAKAAR